MAIERREICLVSSLDMIGSWLGCVLLQHEVQDHARGVLMEISDGDGVDSRALYGTHCTLRRKARAAATASEIAIPVTHAAQPSRSNNWPSTALPTSPPKK